MSRYIMFQVKASKSTFVLDKRLDPISIDSPAGDSNVYDEVDTFVTVYF